MFKYGGPIKEGVMHGMKNGGRAALVGNPVFPKDSSGRAHHAWPYYLGAGIYAAGRALLPRIASMGSKYLPKVKRMFGTTTPAKFTRGTGSQSMIPSSGNYSPVTSVPAKFNPNWLGGDPIVKSLGWAGKTLTNPAAKGFGKGVVRFAGAPSTLIGGLWFANGRWFNKKGDELDPNSAEVANAKDKAGGPPGGGDQGMMGTGEWFAAQQAEKDKNKAAKMAEEAKAARKARTERYLDTMGYDKAKKTAMGDALIDASAIVQAGTEEGGSLKHADWSKMINQAIQATGKRLDKPEQIREAVGLMQTKADIQKDVSAEENALAKLLKTKQIEKINKDLEGNTFRENLVAVSKTMSGQEGIDTAVQLTEGKNFRGNIINVSDFNKILKKMKKETGMDDQTVIIQYAQAAVDKNPGGFEDGHYTVGNNVITVKDDQVISVE